MRKSTILLLIFGFISLVIGSILAIPPLRASITHGIVITSTGIIGYPDSAEPQVPQGPTSATTLDKIGYLTVLASIGFFTTAFLHNRKPT
jgi:UPF0716 family protein affecting phage T7 exclusion